MTPNPLPLKPGPSDSFVHRTRNLKGNKMKNNLNDLSSLLIIALLIGIFIFI